MLFKRFKDSLAFRIASFYKKALKTYPFRSFKQKEAQSLSIVMLCGLQQLDLLQENILSVCKQFGKLPSIYVFTDTDLDIELCKMSLKWVPSKLIVIGAKSCFKYHKDNGNELLATFAEQNPMGLKMAAIMQIMDNNEPILYCDTDVLWFKDPEPIISAIISNPHISMVLSQDFQKSYDECLVKEENLEILSDEPFYCAGIMLLKSFSPSDKNELKDLLKLAVRKSNHFTEQTIFAYLNKIKGNISLNMDEFCITLHDQFDIIPTKKSSQIARHYIGAVRHQFWRDAFFARFNYFKN